MSTRAGVWVAVEEGSETRIFGSELAALRHAVDRQMTVVPVPWGQSVEEVLLARWAEHAESAEAES